MVNFFASFGNFFGNIVMLPKETDDTFDNRQGMIGTGPFFLKEWVPSVKFVLERNPDYWDKDFVLIDGKELPIVSEYAQQLAQFKAGSLHYYRSLRAEDDLTIIKDQPKIQLYESGLQAWRPCTPSATCR